MTKSQTIGKYQILDTLGRSGFATVYKAHDPGLNRSVALKVLHPYLSSDPDFAARFKREAQIAAGLHHPNIVSVYEAGEAEGRLYIAMAYLPGRTLRRLLAAADALSLERALPILAQVAEALDYAHAQGVVHREVKPASVMVEERGDKVQASLLDFGLVKAVAQSSIVTLQGTLLGSPEYMAPEQAESEGAAEVGPAADRYALGIVAYHMLTGRVPFPGNTSATLDAHQHKTVPSPRSLRPELPESVAAVLLKMLAKNPVDRYPSACAFVEELDRAWQTEHQASQYEVQLAPLYERLQAAVEGKNWAEALDLGGQIRAVGPDYRDVSTLMDNARQQLQRSRGPGVFRQVPRRTWVAVGAAVAAVLSGLVSLGLSNSGNSGQVSPTSTGVLDIPQTWAADLDKGIVSPDLGDADIWFQAVNATQRYLMPLNGAEMAKVGTLAVSRSDCAAAPLSTSRIDVNDLPPGTYVCVRTNQGRYSGLRANAAIGPSPGTFKIDYTTWE